MKFEFSIELNEEFRRVLSNEIETEISIVITAENYATASRMVRTILFKNAGNIYITYKGAKTYDERI